MIYRTGRRCRRGGGIPIVPSYLPYAEDPSPDQIYSQNTLPQWYTLLAPKPLSWYVPRTPIHGTAMPQAKSHIIKLTLEEELMGRLDKLVPMVSQSAAAREFGIEVDRHLVSRVALLRGLSAMEAAIPAESAKSRPSAPKTAVAPPPPLALPAVSEESTSTKADAEGSDPSVAVEFGADGLIVPPDGWNAWSKSERVPLEQAKVHEHYESGGLHRYWGRSGEEIIAFYWNPDPEGQDCPMYKHLDQSGKEIKVQSTPYGPGHMIPHGWSE